MADERDLELLDDYLSNRMGGVDRSEFEQKIQADPDLRSEYSLQKALLQGIRDARAAELKSMLRNVPVSSRGQGNALAGKALLAALTIVLAATTYWFLTREKGSVQIPAPAAEQKITDEQPVVSSAPPESNARRDEAKPPVRKTIPEPDKNQTSAGTEHSQPSLSKKPDPILPPAEKKEDKANEAGQDALNPASDKETSGGDSKGTDGELRPNGSSFLVQPVTGNSRYTFHYQFRDGKLFLYGPFTKDQYTVSEFFTNDTRAVFLHYDNRYYLLDRENSEVKPLTPLTDRVLLEKLDKYRGSK